MAGTMNRRKQNAETLCRGKSLVSVLGPLEYRFSTNCRIYLNNSRISLVRYEPTFDDGKCNILGTLLPHRIYLLPDFSTPVDKEIYVALDILWSLGVANWVNLDGHIIEA